MNPDVVSGGKWSRSRDGCDRRMGRSRSRKSDI